jgi:hypothetical protein
MEQQFQACSLDINILTKLAHLTCDILRPFQLIGYDPNCGSTRVAQSQRVFVFSDSGQEVVDIFLNELRKASNGIDTGRVRRRVAEVSEARENGTRGFKIQEGVLVIIQGAALVFQRDGNIFEELDRRDEVAHSKSKAYRYLII